MSAVEEKKMRAELNHQSRVERIKRVQEIAIPLAPAFRDKFDFSDPKNFYDMADLAWKAAEGLLDRTAKDMADSEKIWDEDVKKAEAEELKRQKEAIK